MKCAFFFAMILGGVLQAQTTPAADTKPEPPSLKDDKVVAVIEGKEWKRSDLEHFIAAMRDTSIPQQFYGNKRAFLETFAKMTMLANAAEKAGMDKVDPHKWRLMYNRELYLAQIYMSEQQNHQLVLPAEQKAYYDAHLSDYNSAKVKVLYLSFNDAPMKSGDPKAKKPRTSAEVEKLAADIVKQARAGSDFVQLVEKYSDDAESKAKQGDFNPIKPNDNSLPPQIKSAVFALKPGQVSDAVRQTGGFWIFRLEEFVTTPFEQVRDDIYLTLQGEHFKQWMDEKVKNLDLQFKDDAYLDYKSPIE